MTLSAIHNNWKAKAAKCQVVCDIGGYDFVSYSQRVYALPARGFGCLWYRGDMTLSAIHNSTRYTSRKTLVVCDIGGIWLCQLINCKYKKNFLVEGEKGIGLEYSGWVFALEFVLDCVLGNCEILCKGHGLGNAWIWGVRQYGGCQDFLRV